MGTVCFSLVCDLRVAASRRPGGAVLVIARSLRRGNSDRDCFAPLAMTSGLLGDRTRLHAMDLRFGFQADW